jgi:hypothetical protein
MRVLPSLHFQELTINWPLRLPPNPFTRQFNDLATILVTCGGDNGVNPAPEGVIHEGLLNSCQVIQDGRLAVPI